MIESRTLSQQTYSVLRDRILEGAYARGQFLREVDLADQLGVSRTPVREALARLASEGFVERLPRRGFRVPDDAVADIVELYPIVAALEAVAGRLALPNLGPADIRKLRSVNARLETAVRNGDAESAVELNYEFHRLICERSGNHRLALLLEDLRTQMERLETWYYSDERHGERSVREHARLLDALAADDAESVVQILEHNMSLTYTTLRGETGAELSDPP